MQRFIFFFFLGSFFPLILYDFCYWMILVIVKHIVDGWCCDATLNNFFFIFGKISGEKKKTAIDIHIQRKAVNSVVFFIFSSFISFVSKSSLIPFVTVLIQFPPFDEFLFLYSFALHFLFFFIILLFSVYRVLILCLFSVFFFLLLFVLFI